MTLAAVLMDNDWPKASASTMVGQRSRSRIAAFRLHRPQSVGEALQMRASAPGGVSYMGGGLDLVNQMKEGMRRTEIIHLGRIAELKLINPLATGTKHSSGLRIGALATHHAVATHPWATKYQPHMSAVWGTLGSPRIRLRGTVGGNLMALDPQYDVSPMLAALGATVNYAIPAGTFGTKPVGESLPPAALALSVDVPCRQGSRLIVDRSLKPALSVFLGIDCLEDCVTSGRVAIGCAHEMPIVRSLPLQKPLTFAEIAARAGDFARAVVEALPPLLDDWQSSNSYRRIMLKTLITRQLTGLAIS